MANHKTTNPKSITVHPPFDVTIKGLTKRGDGYINLQDVKDHPLVQETFSRLTDKDKIIVPFTLPEEQVSIRLRHKSRTELVGSLEKIHEPSQERVKAPCQHFGICGGCSLQHYSENLYKDFKKGLVTNALQNHDLDISLVQDPIFIGAGQRRRIDFMARKWDGEVKMGFHEFVSKKPFNVKECPLITKDIPPLFQELRALLTPLLESEKVIHIFITEAQNGIDLLLAGFKNQIAAEHRENLVAFSQKHNLAKLALKVKKKEFVFHERATPTVRFGNHDVSVTSFGFLQATAKSDEIFGSFLASYFPPSLSKSSPLTIVDLFCGRGTLSLNLTKLGHTVAGYECDGQALDALNKVTDPLLSVHNRNLFESPLSPQELAHFDAVVMNPPRAGAASQTKAIADSSIQKLVYISCNAETFARDAKVLQKAGLVPKAIVPVDQFTWTPHVEIMAYFER